MAEFSATILVGVGGTGCDIADRISKLAIQQGLAQRGKLVVMGFDTDENDMKRRGSLEKRRRIRFSTTETVYALRNRYPSLVESWFVPDNDLTTEVRQMRLLDGAGQIRMLARLGLQVALTDPQIEADIDHALSAIAHHRGDAFTGKVNVLLVGSLAGATGSGSFLQIGLTLADRLRTRGMSPSIRGIFLLPEVFTKAARLPTDQIPNVLANGYAALRELNAVFLQGTGRLRRPIDFPYAPGANLRPDGLPFSSVTLIDYDNFLGGNLGNDFEAYKKMLVRAAYTMLFTPIGDRAESQMANDIRAKVSAAATDETRYYSGIGVSALVYPRDEILHYLALRFAQQIIQGDWLRLDRSYRQKVERFERRKAEGETNLTPPRRADSFIEDLRQLATVERQPFFRRIHANVHAETVDGRGLSRIEHRHEKYLDALEAHIRGAFWGYQPELRMVAARHPMEKAYFGAREQLVGDVIGGEADLDRCWSIVEAAVRDKPEDIFANAMLSAEEEPPENWQPHHLQFHLIKPGGHLVEARYFLYCLRHLIAERLKTLDVERLRRKVLAVAAIFDEDHVEQGAKQGRRGSIKVRILAERLATSRSLFLANEVEQFKARYCNAFNDTIEAIRDFAGQFLMRQLYERLDSQIERLLAIFERFFFEIEPLQDQISAQLDQLERYHEASRAGDGNRYVYAGTAAKAEMWKEISGRMVGSTDDSKVNAALLSALYNTYRQKRSTNRYQSSSAMQEDFVGQELFKSEVVEGFCRRYIGETFADVHSFALTEAIKREAALMKRDWREHFIDIVQTVSYQSQPFLAYHDASAGQRLMFWAVSPRNQSEIGDDEFFINLFTRNNGESPLVEAEFPDNEVSCLNLRVNLALTDLRKLHPGDLASRNVADDQQGIYDHAYRDMVERMIVDKSADPNVPARDFTPHLHRDWHKPGVLPEIFETREASVRQRQLSALVHGIALGLLPQRDDNGTKITYCRRWERLGTGRDEEAILQGHDDAGVMAVLEDRPELVDSILLATEDLRRRKVDAEDRIVDNARETRLARALSNPNAMARLLAIARKRQAGIDELVLALVESLLTSVRTVLFEGLTDLEPRGRQNEIDALIAAMVAAAIDMVRSGKVLSEPVLIQLVATLDGLVQRLKRDWRDSLRP